MSFCPGPSIGFNDCLEHWPDVSAELFIVEGESAARAVVDVCDPAFQAVLPMQGKPINAAKATPRAIQKSVFFDAIRSAIAQPGQPSVTSATCRFRRIVLLFDPDADGIHCGALMLIYFHRLYRALLEQGVVCLVRAPLFGLMEETTGNVVPFAYTEEEFHRKRREVDNSNLIESKDDNAATARQTIRFRGLASMPAATLRAACIDRSTRKMNRLGIQDAEAALAVFGGARHPLSSQDSDA